eukprot:Rhum_TRINITY_DN14941_c7_g1::Rhum_TRINITY_DN14941_c7_g1_i2::g.127075::m.127075
MLVTASWGGAEVAVELGAECRSVAALRRNLQEALPELDMEAVRSEVCGRAVDDEEVLGLTEGSVIDITATQAALAAATLREEGCDVDFNGFCRAAEQEDLRLCKLYLEAGVVCPSGVDTPLHIAVRNDSRELLELLLDTGCDTEVTDDYGNSPLHVAVHEENVQLAKLLLDAGCDKESKNAYDDTPLHVATATEAIELVKLLLDAGCDKESKNAYDDTPLHVATATEAIELVKLLLDAGCAKDAKNNAGDTPLRLARDMMNTELVKLLVDAGCSEDETEECSTQSSHAEPSSWTTWCVLC